VQPEVIQQRITAARHLRGKLQSDLDRELAAYGFSLKEAGELERGAKTLQPKHVGPLAQILQVPEAWFTSEHLDLTGPADDATDLVQGALAELLQVARRALEVAVENNDMLNRAITSRDLDTARIERTVAALRSWSLHDCAQWRALTQLLQANLAVAPKVLAPAVKIAVEESAGGGRVALEVRAMSAPTSCSACASQSCAAASSITPVTLLGPLRAARPAGGGVGKQHSGVRGLALYHFGGRSAAVSGGTWLSRTVDRTFSGW
jgi:hypothetical protein